MQLRPADGRPDYEALAAHADQQAEATDTLYLAALWRDLANTYRELHRDRKTRRDVTRQADSDR